MGRMVKAVRSIKCERVPCRIVAGDTWNTHITDVLSRIFGLYRYQYEAQLRFCNGLCQSKRKTKLERQTTN